MHTVRRLIDSGRRALGAVAAALVLAACTGGGDGRAGGESAGAAPDSFKVALLTPGPISDRSWNGGAYDGLMRIRDSLGAAVSHIQTKTPADFEENFRQYGQQEYDLVFGHGFEFQDAAERVGPDFPKTVYITTSGNRRAQNVAPIVFGMEEPSYLAGALAGSITKSGVIGVIGGQEIPPVRSSFEAFAAGAKAVRPDVRLLTSYIGNWDDVSAGREQALAQITRGADVIFQNADAAGHGIFQAARQSRDVYVFGTNSNQNDVAPEHVVASVVIDLPHAFLTVAREVKEGRFTPRVIRLGQETEVVTLVHNPRLARLATPDIRARLDSLRREIDAGRITVPRLEFVQGEK